MLGLVPSLVELVPYVGGAAGAVLFGQLTNTEALYLIGGTLLGGHLVRSAKLGPFSGLEPDASPGPVTMVTRLLIPGAILFYFNKLTFMNILAYKLGEVTAEVMFQGQGVMGAIMS